MDEEISSTLAACSVAPWDMLWAEAESSSEPEATFSEADWTSATTSRSLPTISLSEEASTPISSFWSMSSMRVKSPSAMALANPTPLMTGPVMALVSTTATTMPSRMATMRPPIMTEDALDRLTTASLAIFCVASRAALDVSSAASCTALAASSRLTASSCNAL
ncbi:hypothetical protein DSECCO2_661210 [anaerobic digester metagenome]